MVERAYRKKLIDVSIPLEIINQAAIREKAIRHGHPSTLHPWWSRKPLAACRAILFAALVDDPSEHKDIFDTEEAQEQERQRLFGVIKDAIKWENLHSSDMQKKAQKEIHAYTDAPFLPVRDPFCGGGSIPLEAQRLGLQARSSDLNPVAVLITKALIEIPPLFAGRPPVAPTTRQNLMSSDWQGAQGLAHDINYYGQWIRNEAEKRIGYLYPKVSLPAEYGSGEATVIAWLWVRTVTCPNPACGAQMPLTSKWWLSKKAKKQVWVDPIVERNVHPASIHFDVRQGREGTPQEGTVNRKGATCIVCNTPVPFPYIRDEGKEGRMKAQLLAIVAEGKRGRIYLSATKEHCAIAEKALPADVPDAEIPERALGFRVQLYGLTKYRDLFTPRQLVALTALSDLINEVRERVLLDARHVPFPEDQRPLDKRGIGKIAYADAIATYLALAIDRLADRSTTVCSWDSGYEKVRNTFARQAIPMIWDFAEANPFSESTGNFEGAVAWIVEVIKRAPCSQQGEADVSQPVQHERVSDISTVNEVYQRDATVTINGIDKALIMTDPPYYDNIGYAHLSDFFYIWLRRSLKDIYPKLFETLLTPKEVELVADPARFGGNKEKAQAFFEGHLSKIFARMYKLQSDQYPMILFYAFKQTDTEDAYKDRKTSTHKSTSMGWETMLSSLIQEGFTITGTWPLRTEMTNRSVGLGTNALASSIVLVCRPRPKDAGIASRRQFLEALRSEFPPALKKLQHDGIAPVDLAQACVGPGMAIYSRYHKVVEADGTLLPVRTALQLINRALDELLSEQESEYDAETRWAITWFELHGTGSGTFGSAETLSKAKNISIASLEKMGWVEARAGKVRLRRRDELKSDWSTGPLTVWECTQRIIHGLSEQGEERAANILRASGERGEVVRELAYRLYTICERKGWAQEASVYNALITSWSGIRQYAQDAVITVTQHTLG